MAKDTIIVVGVTEVDGYGNLLVTPQGGGDQIKIAAKREGLHNLFQQGKAVMLHWEVFNKHPYVADAKLVEGELPEPQNPESPPLQQDEPIPKKTKEQEIAEHVWWKELGEMLRAKDIDMTKPAGKLMRTAYYAKMMSVLPIKIEDK